MHHPREKGIREEDVLKGKASITADMGRKQGWHGIGKTAAYGMFLISTIFKVKADCPLVEHVHSLPSLSTQSAV